MISLYETDIEDDQGNIVIKPGLKVRHKASQYEYTVEDVIETGDDLEVVLRLPEEPRVDLENPQSQDDVITSTSSSRNNSGMIYEYEVSDSGNYYFPDDDIEAEADEVDMMSVPRKEFEKDYEVK